ncbi:MAG: hypothetical protein KC428_06840 [Flavobacteriales bacterium]|nr:hypothetical protein [Flavobacteriales bacterium]
MVREQKTWAFWTVASALSRRAGDDVAGGRREAFEALDDFWMKLFWMK